MAAIVRRGATGSNGEVCLPRLLSLLKAVDHFSQMLVRDHSGVVDAREIIGCIPQGVTVEQAMAVVVKYLREHPERLHLKFVDLIVAAQRKAFPCS